MRVHKFQFELNFEPGMHDLLQALPQLSNLDGGTQKLEEPAMESQISW